MPVLKIVGGQIRTPAVEYKPEFLEPLGNYTIPQGREVTFTCVVNHLGLYKVAWIKADSKAILAIHTHLIAHNNRLAVTHNGHNTWKLFIYNVQRNDSGSYMCQINTDPMLSQMGNLEVLVPPDILNDGSSTDQVAHESGSVKLKCLATGVPDPLVYWKREDNKNIIFRQDNGRERLAIRHYENETLQLHHIQRTDMGIYLCIANNGVQPIISKRFFVQVHFPPVIKVTNQLIVAPLGKDVFLQCHVETSPKAMCSWFKDTGEKLMHSSKYSVGETQLNDYTVVMNLTIRNMEKKDFGSYRCTASNTLETAEGNIRLQELRQDKQTTTQSSLIIRFKEPHKKEPEHIHGKDKNYLPKKKKPKIDEDKQELTTGLSKTDFRPVETIVWSTNQSSQYKNKNNKNSANNQISLPLIRVYFLLVTLVFVFKQ